MRTNILIFIMLFVLIFSGCSTEEKVNLEDSMNAIIDYKLHEVGSEQSDEVKKWLANAILTGVEGQYFIFQDGSEGKDYMYSYVYRKGYSDYDVSFIYEPTDQSNRGKIHVTGTEKNPINEKIVEIKSINDLSILFILSDESLKNKLE
ncbi:hypothetical protein J2T13_003118 [Paenibacillus sp. DS2015]|uniref:hypothetical protein n=1 Tax=Paenibacillus sp. DS2015 TaxID=3373917 RepID=UPI003D1F2A61